METNEENPVRAIPRFGILSIVVPVVGVICLSAVNNDNTRTYVFWITVTLGLVSIFGAWARHEKYLVLRFIGLALLSPLLAFALFGIALTFSHGWHM